MRHICLQDKQNKITYYPKGSHNLLPEPEMTHVSFLHEGDGEPTILGAKYERCVYETVEGPSLNG